MKYTLITLTLISLASCRAPVSDKQPESVDSIVVIRPVFSSDSVRFDSDDPAIWINPTDSSQSLILGTDKGGDNGDGALFVFDLLGKEIREKRVANISRPNNVDVAYGLQLGNRKVDIAVLTERNTNSIRVYSLPDLKPIDSGGLPVFEGNSLRAPMGVALYSDPGDNGIYAIVGRKTGPMDGTYLWQYRLEDHGNGSVKGTLVRKVGYYSGKNEIESIAIDNELGFIYCSDESHGIRKYYAHPDSSTTELALFGTTGFTDDHEGISIYKFPDGTGYILVSDQQENQFRVFPREGTPTNPHDHPLLTIIRASTIESDGSEVTSLPLPGFPHGLFVAMSNDRTFQLYRWEDLAGRKLKISK
jgi:3-phytase